MNRSIIVLTFVLTSCTYTLTAVDDDQPEAGTSADGSGGSNVGGTAGVSGASGGASGAAAAPSDDGGGGAAAESGEDGGGETGDGGERDAAELDDAAIDAGADAEPSGDGDGDGDGDETGGTGGGNGHPPGCAWCRVDDGNPCTWDGCTPENECTVVPAPAGIACTVGDFSGHCIEGTTVCG